jgi:hypothetical protein
MTRFGGVFWGENVAAPRRVHAVCKISGDASGHLAGRVANRRCVPKRLARKRSGAWQSRKRSARAACYSVAAQPGRLVFICVCVRRSSRLRRRCPSRILRRVRRPCLGEGVRIPARRAWLAAVWSRPTWQEGPDRAACRRRPSRTEAAGSAIRTGLRGHDWHGHGHHSFFEVSRRTDAGPFMPMLIAGWSMAHPSGGGRVAVSLALSERRGTASSRGRGPCFSYGWQPEGGRTPGLRS